MSQAMLIGWGGGKSGWTLAEKVRAVGFPIHWEHLAVTNWMKAGTKRHARWEVAEVVFRVAPWCPVASLALKSRSAILLKGGQAAPVQKC
jgi:hypothetical protein